MGILLQRPHTFDGLVGKSRVNVHSPLPVSGHAVGAQTGLRKTGYYQRLIECPSLRHEPIARLNCKASSASTGRPVRIMSMARL